MRFKIQTLIDITETKARFNKNDPEWHQQQNYITLLQTLGLRINPEIVQKPTKTKVSIDNLGFGKTYKGKHNVWSMVFENSYEGAITLESLQDDFNLVPVIDNLDETVKLETKAFITSEEQANILFKYVDYDNT